MVQKGQMHTVGYAACSRYAVGVSAKRSTHTVDLANMGGGDRYLWCKKVKPTKWGTQYAVGLDAKRSTHTLYLANMGGGDRYL